MVKLRNSLSVQFKLFLENLLFSLWNIFKKITFLNNISLSLSLCYLLLISSRSLDPCSPSIQKGKLEMQKQTDIHSLDWYQLCEALIS